MGKGQIIYVQLCSYSCGKQIAHVEYASGRTRKFPFDSFIFDCPKSVVEFVFAKSYLCSDFDCFVYVGKILRYLTHIASYRMRGCLSHV